MRREIRYREKIGGYISIDGVKLLRLRCCVLVGTGSYAIVYTRDSGREPPSGAAYHALTAAEVGVKTDEYSGRQPAVDLDLTDVDGMPLPQGGVSIGLTSAVTGTFTSAGATAYWQAWYE